MIPSTTLPLVLAGPVLRRLEPQRLAIWLVGSQPLQAEFLLDQAGIGATVHCEMIPVGTHAFIHLLDIHFDQPLPSDVALEYDLRLANGQGIADWAPHLLYPGASRLASCYASASTKCSTAPAASLITRPPTACCAPTACWPPARAPRSAPPYC